MAVTAVFGVDWGDEGKGKVIDAMLEKERFDIVARWNGGDNAGHSIETDDFRVGLHLVPSGILHPGVVNVMANGELTNLESLKNEIEGLEKIGVKVTPDRLILSERAHLILPYYREIEKRKEATRKIGTTGRGIGVAYTLKPDRVGVRVVDLLDSGASFIEKVRLHAEENGFEIDAEKLLERQRHLLKELEPHLRVEDTVYFFRKNSGADILLEGAQGALLDIDAGTYPYVTSSNASPNGAYIGCLGIPRIDKVIGVMKGPYITRVGGGPFPTTLITEEENTELEHMLTERKKQGLSPLEDITEEDLLKVSEGDRLAIAKYMRVRGFEYGTTTGRARRVGWQDLVAARYAFTVAGNPGNLGGVELVLTKMDVADGLPEINVCTGYRINGVTTDHFPADSVSLSRAVPIYERLEGWKTNTRGLTGPDNLPRSYFELIKFLENGTGVRVTMVSTGPKRREIIHANDHYSY